MENTHHNDEAVLAALSNLMSIGSLRNSSATNFVVHASQQIIPAVHKTKKAQTQTYGSPVLLNDSLSITDFTDKEQDIEDEYSFILNIPAKVRRYELRSRETKNDVTIEFSNYIFGNFCIDENSDGFNKSLLINTFSRSRVIDALMNSFGFMSINEDENKYSETLRNEIFQKLNKVQPSYMLTRSDNSKVFILKVGDILIYTKDSDEKMGQFLVFSADMQKWTSQVYLCYAKINMELLETSALYRYNVANVLVNPTNLNNSRYIGTVLEDEIAIGIEKLDVPFADPVSIPLENISSID